MKLHIAVLLYFTLTIYFQQVCCKPYHGNSPDKVVSFSVSPSSFSPDHNSLDQQPSVSQFDKNQREIWLKNKKKEFDLKHKKQGKHRIRNGESEQKYVSLMETKSLFINVMDFNATNDGNNDCSNSFQNAMNYANSIGGAIVYVPSGIYLFTNQINIPESVSLIGSYLTVPSHYSIGKNDTQPRDGTVFNINFGKNYDPMNTTYAAIIINDNALLKGVSIYYPEQKCDGSVPSQYSPAVYMTGSNAAIEDVECLNCYVAIIAIAAHRHYIARIQGQPIYIGVYVDETYDIGRIEDVHFNPWFCNNPNYTTIQSLYGRSFVFGRSDWEYVFNTFSYAYSIGYHFIETPTGSMNGNFLGIGTDSANNASIKVDASQAPGLLITNCEFTAFYDSGWAPISSAIPTQILIDSSNTGPVIFNSCSFWGPTNSIATIYSSGTTMFKSCVFVEWDEFNINSGAPAIYSNNGNLVVESNIFMQPKQQLYMAKGTQKVIFTSNILEGGQVNATFEEGVLPAIDNNL